MRKRIVSKIKELALKALRYYISRWVMVFIYAKDLLIAVSINALIMLSLCFLTQFAMELMNVYPKGLVGGDPLLFGYPTDLTSLAALALSIGIIEETVFRCFIQEGLLGKFMGLPRWFALVIAALIFGAAHLQNPGGLLLRLPQAVGAAGSGVWLGHIYNKRGLRFGILVHAAYDFAIFVLVFHGPNFFK